MKLVIIESPYKATTAEHLETNLAYARALCLDALWRGESPFCGHLQMTQFLDDLVPRERTLGIESTLAWTSTGATHIFGVDLGMSGGMAGAWERLVGQGVPCERRKLGPDWEALAGRNLRVPMWWPHGKG